VLMSFRTVKQSNDILASVIGDCSAG